MGEKEFFHKPVMFDECMRGLDIKPDGIYVDCTLGGGGHSYGIASALTSGKLIAVDRDSDAVEAASERLRGFGDKVEIFRDNYKNIKSICESAGIYAIDGALMDLGVSSYQLDDAERGFSYGEDGKLDMRMDRRGTLTAYDVVNGYSFERLKRVIYDYGEERYAPKIAAAIVREREKKAIEGTLRLADIVKSAVPGKSPHHPAKRTFQAIRIEVNGELDAIEPALRDAVSLLKKGGRAVVVTFHSLEDRIVKRVFAELAEGCTCPKDFPVCVCGKKPVIKTAGFGLVSPSAAEIAENPRSRSAKLRIAEKI